MSFKDDITLLSISFSISFSIRVSCQADQADQAAKQQSSRVAKAGNF
jgi:hypothetical protein